MKNPKIEVRQTIAPTAPAEDENIVEGMAIGYNSPTVLWVDRFGKEYREQIDAHALDGVDLSETPLVYNHSWEKADILARSKDGTLTLENRPDGLYFRAKLTTNRGADVYSVVKSGEVAACSFGFIVEEEVYNEKENLRTIKKIGKLMDISIVDDPAYPQTHVEARKMTGALSERVKKEEQRRVLILKALL